MMRDNRSLLLIFSLLSSAVVGDVNDPQYLARVQYFQVKETSEYTCTDPGARCEFKREEFESAHFGRGQETQISDKAVWASTVDGSLLSLGQCAETTCEVVCNANCTCVTGGSQCETGVAPPPTSAPVSAPLVGPLCSAQKATEHCPKLMQTALPLGNEKWFDCFNFCGGVFDSACRAGEDCSNTVCTNATEAGTLTGEVLGCTVDHLAVEISSKSVVSSSLPLLVVLAAGAWNLIF